MSTPRFASARFAAASVTFMLLLSLGAANAFAGPCPPHQPSDNLRELRYQFDKPAGFLCAGWYQENNPTFGNWQSGGSMNLPVVSAIVGLYRFPDEMMRWHVTNRVDRNPSGYKISYRNWWIWFLASQTGQDPYHYSTTLGFNPPPTQPANLGYFKGTELSSNIYEASVVTSVIAVRHWAYTHNSEPLKELTSKYLRANWAIYAMAAGKGPVWTYEIGKQTNGQEMRTPTTGGRDPADGRMEYNPAAPRKGNGYRIDSPFLALPGARSKLLGGYDFDDKATLFDRAMRWEGASNYESKEQAAVLNWLEDKWQQAGRDLVSLYGLTEDDRTAIRELINSGTNAASFLPWIQDIRLATTYRILGWPGHRAGCMEKNMNGNGRTMLGILYTADDPNDTNPSHAKATFLFPWTDKEKARPDGKCEIKNGRMIADNYPGQTGHPYREVYVDLPPLEELKFHLVLSPGNQPFLETNTPKTLIQPTIAPVVTPGDTAYGGDMVWVSSMLPDGATAGEYNEGWNWITEDPPSYPTFHYVHQSALVNGDVHQHYFTGATETITVNSGESLYAYVYLDPVNPPSQVMLQWYEPSTGWEHRAYWGVDRLPYWGTSGTASRLYMGPLPPAGEWTRLEVPAKLLDLEGRTLTGMAFTLVDGMATWGEAGKNVYGMSTNVAAGAATSQSSTWGGLMACLAVDGDRNGYVSHTNSQYQPWWQVNLGSRHAITAIKIWNRADCCAERLTNFNVMVSDAPFDGTAPVHQVNYAGQAGRPSLINMNQRGQYVRVQLNGTNYLSLQEVEVLGYSLPPPEPSQPTPSMAINDVSVAEGNVGSVNAIFTVSLSAASASNVQLNFSTANGTAAAYSDYTPTSGTLIFYPGETAKTIHVPVVGDTAVEGNETYFVNLSAAVGAVITGGQGLGTIVNDDTQPPPQPSGQVLWVEDSLPPGAVPDGNEAWNWRGSIPPFSGSAAHQSGYATGIHQHYFWGATGANALTPSVNDVLFAYVYLDPMNPPTEIMLQWADSASWNHRAYWGANQIPFGDPTINPNTRRYMGPLPEPGRWVRLEVPSYLVGADGLALQGMAFTLYGGIAAWDYAGKSRQDTVWVEDSVPYGATPVNDGDTWNWMGGHNPAPFSGTAAHQSNLVVGLHQHYFYNATGASALQVNVGDKLFTYVYLDPLNPPQEVMLQWLDGNTNWVRAYWGENRIDFGMPGLPKTYAGPLPEPGRWVRMEVPATTLGLEGRTITGLAFTLHGGRATWDRAGKAP